MSRLSLLTLSLAALLVPSAGAAQDDDVVRARRVSDIAAIAVAEYEEGVRDGHVVREQEYEEARLFVAEALASAADLGAEARQAAVPPLEALARGIEALAAAEALHPVLARLRSELAAAVGTTLDPLPHGAPSLERGARLYAANCAGCHGDGGAGDGALAEGLDPPPADLSDRRALAAVPPVEFFRKINVGVAGTAMPGFADRLSVEDRWAVALYAATLRHEPAAVRAGEALLREGCPACAAVVSDAGATLFMSDDDLREELASLAAAPLDEPAMARAVAFARSAGAVEGLGGDRRLEGVRVARAAALAASAAGDLARSGDAAAADRAALDGYLQFERVEAAVRARDAAAARRVERAFAELRAAVQGDDRARVEAAVTGVRGALDAAVATLGNEASPGMLFGQSVVILLREGLEAILIVGALVAIVAKAGAGGRRRDIGWGVAAAAGASLVTAAAFATLFRSATRHQELLEGLTMLVAAGVLFWVSYWLVSKIEVRKWQAFVRGQVERALRSRRTWGLAIVAFLAVYREGFETVLFYAALFTSADGSREAVAAIGGGMAVGGVLLGAVYLAVARLGVRVPLKPFFAVTSAFLYVMAFSFAGQGVAELQGAGVIPATPLAWGPSVPVLGIFPTAQTVVVQLGVAGALFGALAWVFWLEPRVARARLRG